GAGRAAAAAIQRAVRSVIERATLEMVSRLYKIPPGSCASVIGSAADPLAGPGDPPPASAAPAPYVASNAPAPYVATNARVITATTTTVPQERPYAPAPRRQDPYSYYSSSDPASEPQLRRRID